MRSLLALVALCWILLAAHTVQSCSGNTCEDCLQDLNCAWSVGQCFESCPTDVACYTASNFPNQSSAEICAAEETARADTALCERQESCEDCVATTLSSGDPCQWFEEWLGGAGNCQSGCNWMSCGKTRCDSKAEQPPTQAPNDCSGDTCGECLQDLNCAWSVGHCSESCALDVGCYTGSNYPNQSTAEICAQEETAKADAALCESQESCEDCLATVIMSGANTCRWFEGLPGEGNCQSECTYISCGVTTCDPNAEESPTEIPTICRGDTCGECLQDLNCAWSIGQCFESCVVDTACYTGSNFPNQSAAEICAVEETARADAALCDGQENCEDCVATVLSDGNTCRWFGEFPGQGSCESECNWAYCGSTTCDPATEAPPESPNVCSGNTCGECLENKGCAWATGTCFDSCDAVFDVSCYRVEDFEGLTATEVCSISKAEEEDAVLCYSKTSCSDCVNTIKSQGTSTCFWIDDELGGGFCAHQEFVHEGTVVAICPESSCSEVTCEDCLGENCTWIEGACYESCDDIADASCYSTSNFPSLNATEICADKDAVEADAALCSSMESCSTCVYTMLSNGKSCQWFEVDNICASECNLIGCGETTCNRTGCTGETCEECLALEICAWAVGECLGSCDDIADASCYSAKNFPSLTAAEICSVRNTDEDEATLCGSKSNCSECTETELSEGTCVWFEEDGVGGFCSSDSCTSLGCGVTDCGNSCFGDSCEECLQSGDCAWAAGECLGSCDFIGDTSCYSSSIFPNLTASKICRVANVTSTDEALCGSKENCSDCVDTILSDGNATCQWFDDEGACLSECGLSGCGKTMCNVSVCGGDTCMGCLESGERCAWTAGECLDSCDLIADTSCYSVSLFPNLTAVEICDVERVRVADETLCSVKDNCIDCIDTVISDGNTTCQWFSEEEFCGSECGLNGCGSSTCPNRKGADRAVSTSAARTLATMSPSSCFLASLHVFVVFFQLV